MYSSKLRMWMINLSLRYLIHRWFPDNFFFDNDCNPTKGFSVCLLYLRQLLLGFFIHLLNILNLNHIHVLLIFVIFFHISFYTAAPLSLCCTSPEVFKFATNLIEEIIVKGKNQMPSTKFNEWGIIIPLIRQRWYTWIGAGLFSWGWVHQRRCHAILVSLAADTPLDYLACHFLCSFPLQALDFH